MLSKIETVLCYAMQNCEPLNVLIKFDGGFDEAVLSVDAIKKCAYSEYCNNIELSKRAVKDRRWVGRILTGRRI